MSKITDRGAPDEGINHHQFRALIAAEFRNLVKVPQEPG